VKNKINDFLSNIHRENGTKKWVLLMLEIILHKK
jgi:hypothetical protein